MKFVSNDSRIFSPVFIGLYTTVIKIGENIVESSETNFINLPRNVFDVDNITKIRSDFM